jgi:transposase
LDFARGLIKEDFRNIFEVSESWTEGTLELLDWMADASTLFKRSCGTLKRWFDEVTSYFELRITNGVVEGINNKFKLIKRLGYGFSNFDNFKLRGAMLISGVWREIRKGRILLN